MIFSENRFPLFGIMLWERRRPLKTTLTLIAATAGLAFAAPALAQDLPRWSADQACARETSAQAFCVAFEREAFSDLSGVWPTLQPDIRQACLDQVASFGQNSYRLLGGCLEEKLTELRVDYVRRASRADEPDPPKPAEIKPEAQPDPASAEPADKSEAMPVAPQTTGALPEAAVPEPPPASEDLASTPPPVMTPQAAPDVTPETAPEAPKAQ
jgi:hypothetical protein